MKRTVIYARVSTEDQVEKYGLPSQLRACREYAKAHGLEVIAEITDDGISGTILNRPGLDRIRAMVRAGEVDTVLMFDADRLSRELAHLLILKPEIERHASLEFVAAKFEDSPSGRMFFGIRGVIAQYERESTRERTMRGRRERARSGLIVGGRTAYGYRYDAGRLVPDERAATVQRIFDLYDSGRTIRAIMWELRRTGAPTWGGRTWGHSSVRRILGNETYCGVAYYGTLQREGTVLRPSKTERIALSAPPLVDREQWERVQIRLAENPFNGRPSSSYLLRGLLYCHCGKRMHGEGGRSNAYRCSGRLEHACRETVSTAKADAAAWRALTSTLTNAGALRDALKHHEDGLRDMDPATLSSLRVRAAKLRRREEAALSALLDPDLAEGRATIKEQYRTIGTERRSVEFEIAQIERATKAHASTGEWIEDAADLIREAVDDLDQAEKQEFIRRVVERADWANQEITMSVFLAPKVATTSDRYAHFPRVQLVVTARLAA